MNCINITKQCYVSQSCIACTVHNNTEHDTKTEKILMVKARHELTLSQGVEADQNYVSFCTINTAHILTVKVKQ